MIGPNWQGKTVTRRRKQKETTHAITDFVKDVHPEDHQVRFSITSLPDGRTLKPLEVVDSLTGLSAIEFLVRKVSSI
jgi:hypothetical protein